MRRSSQSCKPSKPADPVCFQSTKCWEREIRSLKQGLQAILEEVLRTVLIEIDGILNYKPLGYITSDTANPDPVTPNDLLMGRPDASLPQVVYPESELLS